MTRSLAWGGSQRLSPQRLLNGLMVGLVLGIVAVAVLARVAPLTGQTIFVVAGPSMTPALQVGNLIVVEPVDSARLAVGDVVSIQSGSSKAVFTHRIVRLLQRDGALWIETKGDANTAPDPAILPASDIIGRVVVAIPYAGYLIALGSQPSGAILIVAVGLLLMSLSSILALKRASPLPA